MTIYLSEKDKGIIANMMLENSLIIYEIGNGVQLEIFGKKITAWDNVNNKKVTIKNKPR